MSTPQPIDLQSPSLKRPAGPTLPISAIITMVVGGLCALILAFVLVDPALTGTAAQNTAGSGASTQGANTAAVTPTGQVKRVEVTMQQMSYTPRQVQVDPGDRLILAVRNADTMSHDLAFSTGERTPALAPGQSAQLDLGIIGQDLEGWCTMPGHRQMGMTFNVTLTGPANSANPANNSAANSNQTNQTNQANQTNTTTSAPTMADFLARPATTYVDPTLPPAENTTVHRHTFTVTEAEMDMGGGLKRTVWRYGDNPVGPTLRGKVGDIFEITLVNRGTMDHSIDFHASVIAPDQAMRSIAPGQSLLYRFRAERAGIWMYHCSTMPMSMHIAAGMHGAVIIDPPGLDPVDREYVFVQSEIYPPAAPDQAASSHTGHSSATVPSAAPDSSAIAAVQPQYVTFNGVPFQYRTKPLQVKVGERIRAWVLAAGPNLGSAFHVVGTQFSTVWTEGQYTVRNNLPANSANSANANSVNTNTNSANTNSANTTAVNSPAATPGTDPAATGAQVLPLVAAQGGFVEFTLPQAGSYPFVNHSMVRAEQGASGLFKAVD